MVEGDDWGPDEQLEGGSYGRRYRYVEWFGTSLAVLPILAGVAMLVLWLTGKL